MLGSRDVEALDGVMILRGGRQLGSKELGELFRAEVERALANYMRKRARQGEKDNSW